MFWMSAVMVVYINFWFRLLIMGLFYVLSLLISPLGLGARFLGYDTMIDTLSYSLWVLSVWVLILIVICRSKVYRDRSNDLYFIFLLIVILFTLVLTFSLTNFLGLYIFFEASLIPTLLVIIGWGYQIERLQAGVYFLFYTIFSSLPLLLVILISYSQFGSLSLMYCIDLSS